MWQALCSASKPIHVWLLLNTRTKLGTVQGQRWSWDYINWVHSCCFQLEEISLISSNHSSHIYRQSSYKVAWCLKLVLIFVNLSATLPYNLSNYSLPPEVDLEAVIVQVQLLDEPKLSQLLSCNEDIMCPHPLSWCTSLPPQQCQVSPLKALEIHPASCLGKTSFFLNISSLALPLA